MRRLLLHVIGILLMATGCAPATAPTPAVPAGSASAPANGTPGSAATAPLSDAAYRQQVVDAARAEGLVNATLHTSWTPEGIQRVEDAIEREFGVRIRVNYQPIINYVQRASELFGEAQANVTPSFDLYQSADTTAGMLFRAGTSEEVRWAALLPAGTPPRMIGSSGRHAVVYTDHFGL